MLSEFSRKAKRATVLTSSVAAAALLMGAGAANALLIDNFGGRHAAGGLENLGSQAGVDAGTVIGFASVTAFTQGGSTPGTGVIAKFPATDDAGGNPKTELTTPCAGQGAGGGDQAWCVGIPGGNNGRLTTINARNNASLNVSINQTVGSGASQRPDGLFRMTDEANGNPDSFGEATLFYGDNNTTTNNNGTPGDTSDDFEVPNKFPGDVNLLIKEDIDSNLFGTDPRSVNGMNHLSYGNTTLDSITNAGTDAEKAAEIGMWGFFIDALKIDKDMTDLDITITTDATYDLGFGAASSHAITFKLPDISSDPFGVEIFIPFILFLADENDEAQRLALILALQDVRNLRFQFGGPLGIISNQLSINEISTGMILLPEPGTLAVMGMGLIGLGIARRRRKQAA
jgi:hypothetical protein